MNIEQALLEEYSKNQARKIAAFIGDNETRLAELMDCYFKGPYRLTQRAAFTLDTYIGEYPDMMRPYLKTMVDNLQNDVHVAVKRGTVRLFQTAELPDHIIGPLANLCFGYLSDPKESIAVKVFSMTVLYRIVLKEPDLANELHLLIEEQMPYGSAGFKSRGRKILKKLEKMLT